MATNARVYWPIIGIGFAPIGTPVLPTSGFRAAKGVQSVGTNTNFNLTPVYELGQLSLYDNIEDIPNIEITMDKVIDGYPLIQHLATPRATAKSLAGRYNDQQSMLAIAYYNIANDAASGTPLTIALHSGIYVSAINWNMPVDGNITESVTLTCRDKTWYFAPSGSPWASGLELTQVSGRLGSPYSGNDTPVLASGSVQRRQHVMMGSGNSIWPKDIPGIDSINGFNLAVGNSFGAHIQNITISANLGREDLFEQGQRSPYFRYATFPVQVNTSISYTPSESGEGFNVVSTTGNLSNQTIIIKLTNGVNIDLGTKNKIASITTNGGDTGGANMTTTFNYSNYNDYTCTAPIFDPAGLT